MVYIFVATCPHPIPANGQVTPAGLSNGRHRIGSVVSSYTCDSGYSLVGDQVEITCQTSGAWDSQPPVCTGNRGRELIFIRLVVNRNYLNIIYCIPF